MAAVQLVPASFSVTLNKGSGQFFKSAAVKDFTGAAVDLSAWVSLQAALVPLTPNPTGGNVTFGTVTADATGILTLNFAATDLASASPGSANLIITGKPTSGDPVQLLSSGTATLNGG